MRSAFGYAAGMSQHKTLIGVGWVCLAIALLPGSETTNAGTGGSREETTRWWVGLSPLVLVETTNITGPVPASGSAALVESRKAVVFNVVSLSGALGVIGICLLVWARATRKRDVPPPGLAPGPP